MVPAHIASITACGMPAFSAIGAWMSHSNCCRHCAAVTRIANSLSRGGSALR